MKKPRRYTGILSRPLDVELPPLPNPLLGEAAQTAYFAEIQALDQMIADERSKRWTALKEFYGIHPESSWETVAGVIASAHVPGLLVRKRVKVGRKLHWSSQRLRELRHAVDALRQDAGQGGVEACNTLASQEGWSAAPSTLKARYYEARGADKRVRK